MFDRRWQPVLQAAYRKPAKGLARIGVSADALTLAGGALGLASAACVGWHAFGVALALFLVSRILDGLDGAVARLVGRTDRGAFLDIALDLVVYASIPLGFAFANPAQNALAAGVLLFGFMGTATSFLAFAAVAGRRGVVADAFPNKGIHYLGGVTEGGETIGFFAVMCLWPGWFAWLAWLFAALCLVTTVTRWCWGWQAFGPAKPAEDTSVPPPK